MKSRTIKDEIVSESELKGGAKKHGKSSQSLSDKTLLDRKLV